MNENRIFQAQTPAHFQPDVQPSNLVTEEACGAGRFSWQDPVKDQVLKFFIQNSKTAQFVRCDSMWTWDFNEALDFLSAQRARCWGLKELKSSFQVLSVQANRVLGSIKIVIPQLLKSKVSGTPRTVRGSRLVQRPATRPCFGGKAFHGENFDPNQTKPVLILICPGKVTPRVLMAKLSP